MGNLEEIFSEDNLLAYSRLCIDLAVTVPEKQRRYPFDTLVIPSRGAVPFFFGLKYALRNLAPLSQEHEAFYKGLETSPLLPNTGIAEKETKTDHVSTKVLLIPFTADLNIAQYDPAQNNDEYTSKTRQYWAKVTAAFLKDPKARERDPRFKTFTEVILKDIEGRHSIADFYAKFPKVNKFAIIDTVISGRASNDILKAFDQLAVRYSEPNLSPNAFLIVDENGKKLRQEFKAYLNRKKVSGQVELFEVPRIISEDKGAALLGVCSVIYPSIMKSSRSIQYIDGEFFVGAGNWYAARDFGENNVYHETFKRFMKVIESGINAEFASQYQEDIDAARGLDEFKTDRIKLINHLSSTRVLSTRDADVTDFHFNKRYRVTMPYETSSHVVHVPFDQKATQNLISKINSLGLPYTHLVPENGKTNH